MYKYMVRAYSDASGKRVYGDYSDVFTTCTLPANISKISASARELLSPLAGTKFQRRPTTSWSIM